jgi:4-hydroxy-4-methyl-2-oxoglutarate aldolase
MADNFAQRLSRLDCCAVSDALDQLGLPASVTGLASLAAHQRISGTVITVKLAAGKAPPSAGARHLCTTAIDMAQPGQVIVVEQRTGIECAGWGGILSNAARLRRVAGVIVEGLARDIDEATAIGFTVYARGATARTARGRVHEAATGEPINVGETTVASGDWVVADASGTAFIPASRIADVLDAAERIAGREAIMTKDVLAGIAVSEVMGASYEHLLEKKPE